MWLATTSKDVAVNWRNHFAIICILKCQPNPQITFNCWGISNIYYQTYRCNLLHSGWWLRAWGWGCNQIQVSKWLHSSLCVIQYKTPENEQNLSEAQFTNGDKHIHNQPCAFIYMRCCYTFVPDFKTVVEMRAAWASCQIRKIKGCPCAGNAGNVFPTTAD